MRVCSKCNRELPSEKFYAHQKNHWCKDCAATYQKKNPQIRTPEQIRKYSLKAYYKMTPAQYDEMLANQKGVCAGCGEPPEPGRYLFIDHDHACCSGAKTCGKCIRGLLCRRCNSTLGLVKDNADILRALASYLSA